VGTATTLDANSRETLRKKGERARVTFERDAPAVIEENHGVRHRRNLFGGNFEQPGGE
jgi:hypothetical protein